MIVREFAFWIWMIKAYVPPHLCEAIESDFWKQPG
jgi:hypothetical protein